MVTLYNEDCFKAFERIPDESVHVVITDPPYFLDKLADTWETEITGKDQRKIFKSGTVSSLPGGMKFDPRQGKEFQEFMERISRESLRVLKPGGFFLSFSAPRLYHRLGVAAEDAGFEIRDMWGWLYTQNQAKAMSVRRFLKEEDVPDDLNMEEIDELLAVWKTPQIKSVIEPICLAQKPVEKTFLNNFLKHRVGLINSGASVGEADMFPANIMTATTISPEFDRVFLVPKPGKAERAGAKHLSVKPIALLSQLIRLTVREGQTVLDPFSGSGSTGLAALSYGCDYIGFESNKENLVESKKRFNSFFRSEGLRWKTSGRKSLGTMDLSKAKKQ